MTIQISIQNGNKYLPLSTSQVAQTSEGFNTDQIEVLLSGGCTGITFPGITPLGIIDEKLWLVHDDDPIFITSELMTPGNFNPLEAKINSINLGLDGNIGTLNIDFPDKKFGSHMEPFCIPVKVIGGDPASATSNVLFRGFMVSETGSVDENDDSFGVTANDYKWAFSKLGKFRGKIYTTSQLFAGTMTNDREKGGGSPSIFLDKRKYERFRYRIGGNNLRAGYDSGAKTIFNEYGKPNCASYDFDGLYVIFKEKALPALSNAASEPAYYWTYASIISYIVNFGIVPYTKTGKVEVTGLSDIIAFPEKLKTYIKEVNPTSTISDTIDDNYIRPANFDISGLNPLEALDKAIKAIPGDWHWDLIYNSNTVEIKVINKTKGIGDETELVLTLGKNNKLATDDNDANIKRVSVTRDISERISHSVSVGAPVKIETTIELYPAWTRYIANITNVIYKDDVWNSETKKFEQKTVNKNVIATGNNPIYVGQTVGANQAIVSFENKADYDRWVSWYKGKEDLKLSADITSRYESIFRKYNVKPNSLNEAKTALQLINPYFNVNITSAVKAWDGNYWPDSINTYYQDLITGNEMAWLLLSYLNKDRVIDGPRTSVTTNKTGNGGLSGETTVELDNVSISDQPFVFIYDSKLSDVLYENNVVGYTPGEYLSDNDVIELLENNRWIIPDRKDISYSMGSDNRTVTFSKPQFERKRGITNDDEEKEVILPESVLEATWRKVFMTCTIDSDTNFVLDYLNETRLAKYNNLNLIGYNFDDSNEVVLRIGSILPAPVGQSGHTITYNDGLVVITTQLNDKSALVDWNAFSQTFGGANAKETKFAVENVNSFLQTTIDMVDGANDYRETIDVSLGRLDLSVRPGDSVKEIRNSEDENGNGGYYNLDSYVTGMSISKDGEADSYEVSVNLENRETTNSLTNSVRGK